MGEVGQGLPLAGLLREVAQDIVAAQSRLDEGFVSRRAARKPDAPNPVWFMLDDVTIALEFAATTPSRAGGAVDKAQLLCRLPSPMTAALYGVAVATTARVSVRIAPLTARSRS